MRSVLGLRSPLQPGTLARVARSMGQLDVADGVGATGSEGNDVIDGWSHLVSPVEQVVHRFVANLANPMVALENFQCIYEVSLHPAPPCLLRRSHIEHAVSLLQPSRIENLNLVWLPAEFVEAVVAPAMEVHVYHPGVEPWCHPLREGIAYLAGEALLNVKVGCSLLCESHRPYVLTDSS